MISVFLEKSSDFIQDFSGVINRGFITEKKFIFRWNPILTYFQSGESTILDNDHEI